MHAIHKILATTALCLAVGALEPAFAAVPNQTESALTAPTYEEYLTAKMQYSLEALAIAQGIQDKVTADAAASRWEAADRRLYENPAIALYWDIPTKEEQMAAAAHISSVFGNPEHIFRQLAAEKIRLSKAHYFNSEALALLLAGDPMYAYPCVPATPEVLQLFTAVFKHRLVACVGEKNLSGGPGYTPETAWVITADSENEKAIEHHITRKAKLNDAVGMIESDGMRFNMLNSGRQRMKDATYLFHTYRVVLNSSTSAYQLKQYFRIQARIQEAPHSQGS